MRLLLTRAAEDSARTRVTLEAAGHSVIIAPVLDMAGTGAPWPTGVIDGVVATSGQAFRHLECGPVPETRRLMPLFLVGPRTAEAALARGFVGARLVMPTASALAVALREQSARPHRLVYLAGRDRKPDLEMALTVTGQLIDVVEVYAANAASALDPRAAQAVDAGLLDGILHFSRRSAALLLALTTERLGALRGLAHFCLSDDVAAPLREAGCTDLRIAEAPNETALLALLDRQSV